MKLKLRLLDTILLLNLFLAPSSYAWYTSGHEKAAAMAFTALKGRVPDFFYNGRSVVAGIAVDPDLFKDSTLPQLKKAEGPEHFIDLERLAGHALPNDRRAYWALCGTLGTNAFEIGFLPYAVIEWNQRLTIALAEYRAWPNDTAIRMKCLVYAGIMSHYAGDMTQPLHVTIHFNGRAMPDGSVQLHGIHGKVDGLLTTIPDSTLPATPAAHAFPSLFDSVGAVLRSSASLVDTVYRLGMLDSPDAWRGFTAERLRATALLISDLLLTAWEKSALEKLPQWDLRGSSLTSGTKRSPEPY
jgi:hypothetical protein